MTKIPLPQPGTYQCSIDAVDTDLFHSRKGQCAFRLRLYHAGSDQTFTGWLGWFDQYSSIGGALAAMILYLNGKFVDVVLTHVKHGEALRYDVRIKWNTLTDTERLPPEIG